jgi:hypothetical protein
VEEPWPAESHGQTGEGAGRERSRGVEAEGKLQGVVVAVQRRPAMGDGELPSLARGRSGQGRAGAREAHLRPGQQRERPRIFWAPWGAKERCREGSSPWRSRKEEGAMAAGLAAVKGRKKGHWKMAGGG